MEAFNFNTKNVLDAALADHRRNFINVAILSSLFSFMMVLPSLYMLQVYDRALPSRNTTTLLVLTVMILVAMIVMHFIDGARQAILQRIGLQLQEALGDRVFDAIARKNLVVPSGNAMQPMHDLTVLRQFVGGPGPSAFFDLPWTPLFLGVIMLTSPVLGLFSIGATVITGMLALITERMSTPPLEQAQVENNRASALAAGQLRNAEVAEALGMVAPLRAKWSAIQNRMLALQETASERASWVGAMSRFVRLASRSLMLGLGALMAIQGTMTAGGMIMASILMGRALVPLEQLMQNWKSFVSALGARKRLKALLEEYPPPPPTLKLPRPNGLLSVENVTAAPPLGKKAVILGVTLSIAAGDSVGLVGPSACGKSSLARVLIGLWRPHGGNVRLDGADIANWEKSDLGQWLGYLPQDVELFEGTVAENIARFGETTSEMVIAAATLAGAHELILRLPEGYGTQLSAAASSLSPGQRQRIGLARALYGDTRLVILDEPDASLDDAGLQALMSALAELKRRKVTTIVISHRLPVIQLMDKLIVLREGRLTHYGPCEAVLEALRAPQGKPTPVPLPTDVAKP